MNSSRIVGLRALHDVIKGIGACNDRASANRAARVAASLARIGPGVRKLGVPDVRVGLLLA